MSELRTKANIAIWPDPECHADHTDRYSVIRLCPKGQEAGVKLFFPSTVGNAKRVDEIVALLQVMEPDPEDTVA